MHTKRTYNESQPPHLLIERHFQVIDAEHQFAQLSHRLHRLRLVDTGAVVQAQCEHHSLHDRQLAVERRRARRHARLEHIQ